MDSGHPPSRRSHTLRAKAPGQGWKLTLKCTICSRAGLASGFSGGWISRKRRVSFARLRPLSHPTPHPALHHWVPCEDTLPISARPGGALGGGGGTEAARARGGIREGVASARPSPGTSPREGEKAPQKERGERRRREHSASRGRPVPPESAGGSAQASNQRPRLGPARGPQPVPGTCQLADTIALGWASRPPAAAVPGCFPRERALGGRSIRPGASGGGGRRGDLSHPAEPSRRRSAAQPTRSLHPAFCLRLRSGTGNHVRPQASPGVCTPPPRTHTHKPAPRRSREGPQPQAAAQRAGGRRAGERDTGKLEGGPPASSGVGRS